MIIFLQTKRTLLIYNFFDTFNTFNSSRVTHFCLGKVISLDVIDFSSEMIELVLFKEIWEQDYSICTKYNNNKSLTNNICIVLNNCMQVFYWY